MVCRSLQPEIVRLCTELATHGVNRSEVGYILQLSVDQIDRILEFHGVKEEEPKPIKTCLCCGEPMTDDWLYPLCPDCEKDDVATPMEIDPEADAVDYPRFLAIVRESNFFKSNISRVTRRIAMRAGISCLAAIRYEIRRERELAVRRESVIEKRLRCRDLIISGKKNSELMALGLSDSIIRDTRRQFNLPCVSIRDRVRSAKSKHPTMSNSELAKLLKIDERSVYDALRPKISKRKEIQEYYRSHPNLTIQEIAKRLNSTNDKVFTEIRKLGFGLQTLPLPFGDDLGEVN